MARPGAAMKSPPRVRPRALRQSRPAGWHLARRGSASAPFPPARRGSKRQSRRLGQGFRPPLGTAGGGDEISSTAVDGTAGGGDEISSTGSAAGASAISAGWMAFCSPGLSVGAVGGTAGDGDEVSSTAVDGTAGGGDEISSTGSVAGASAISAGWMAFCSAGAQRRRR